MSAIRISLKLDPTRYERQTFENLGGELVSEREIFDVATSLMGRQESNILEIGMGTGRILRNILTPANLVGLDLDRGMVIEFRRLQRAHRSTSPLVHLVVADAQSLPFRNGCFGAVVCVRALKYVKQPRQAILEMCAALEPGGRLILEFSNVFAPNSLYYLVRNISKKGPKMRTFLPRTISLYLHLSGMNVLGMTGWHKLTPGLTTRMNNSSLLRIVLGLENILQKSTPPPFLSRSILVRAEKIRPSSSDPKSAFR
jgi:ubiquinone/menaquinone biosynthesis C-methylase UbiE